MDAYVRFQTQLRCGNTGRPAGVFATAGRIEDSPHLPDTTRERLQEILRWFNQNLAVPALGEGDWRCIFWFRSDAQPLIHRLWDLVSLLNEEGVHVRKIWTTEPGMIVYSDAHQVGAIPRRRSIALRS